MNIFLSIFTISISALGGLVLWLLNDYSKRKEATRKTKELIYEELLSFVPGFYLETQDALLKNKFINKLRVCWLYCPDNVIINVNVFLDLMNEQNELKINNKEYLEKRRQEALGNLILEMRKDLINKKESIFYDFFKYLLGKSKTDLQAKDVRHYRST